MRDGCHLCETFLDELETHDKSWRQQVVIRDVDQSQEWIQRFGDSVPVLVINDEQICEYFFDPIKLSPYFRDQK